MEVKIIRKECGGTEFLAQPHRLHLGAQNAEGVDRLRFVLPDAWAGCAVALYLRRSDGTQMAPVPLDSEGSVSVDRRLTGCTGGQWMLAAVNGAGYTAYTRPGSYDTYSTLPTDGSSEEPSPTLYEQFVARVLESASAAASSAQKASASAASCAANAEQAQAAARLSTTNNTSSAACADRAEAAAARAELLAPAEGQVLSVNGKGGIVQLGAQDVGAIPQPALPTAGSLLRVLSVDPDTGALLTDTTPMPDLTPFVRSSTIPTDKTAGAVRADIQYGVSIRSDGTLTTAPATTAQLDSMTHCFAPLVPFTLPYGVKRALTAAIASAGWTADEKALALRNLGAETVFYTKAKADEQFLTAQTIPPATKSTLGGVKPGEHCSISADGTLTPDTAYLDLSDDRPASANIDFSKPAYQGRLTYALASSRMTTGKPTQGESYLLSLGWDANNAGSQIALRTGVNPHLQIRGKGSSTEYGDWVTIIDSANLKSYLSSALQQITDMQVALCELYEQKEVNNG